MTSSVNISARVRLIFIVNGGCLTKKTTLITPGSFTTSSDYVLLSSCWLRGPRTKLHATVFQMCWNLNIMSISAFFNSAIRHSAKLLSTVFRILTSIADNSPVNGYIYFNCLPRAAIFELNSDSCVAWYQTELSTCYVPFPSLWDCLHSIRLSTTGH